MLRPTTPAELADLLREASARGEPLAVVGSGSRGETPAAPRLDVTGIGGHIDHDPAELLLTAPASTPLAEVVARLAATGQCLAFEPPLPSALWGMGDGTLGGAIASGLSGPRRPFAGAARDHVLGLTAVTGRGEIFRAGGKVLKNVTGFDLPRLLTGSRGSLAVLTELTLKVLPLAPAQATLSLPAETAAQAVRLMADALMVDGGITGATWRDGTVWLRLETSVGALPSLVGAAQARLPPATLIEDAASRVLWSGLANFADLPAGHVVWRCPLPASRAPALAALLPAAAHLQLDWAGGLTIVALADADFDMHAAVAQAAGRDGHAVRLRGHSTRVPARGALEPALAALNARVKALFDPAHILAEPA